MMSNASRTESLRADYREALERLDQARWRVGAAERCVEAVRQQIADHAKKGADNE